MKRCERCQEEKLPSEFLGTKLEQPWCKACRREDPRGAKLVRDRMIQRSKTPAETREHHQRYKAAHPERLTYRSSKRVLQQAHEMAAQGIEAYKKQAAAQCRAQGFTRGQISQTLQWMDDLAEEIRQAAQARPGHEDTPHG